MLHTCFIEAPRPIFPCLAPELVVLREDDFRMAGCTSVSGGSTIHSTLEVERGAASLLSYHDESLPWLSSPAEASLSPDQVTVVTRSPPDRSESGGADLSALHEIRTTPLLYFGCHHLGIQLLYTRMSIRYKRC
jgi:hypothetical protein